ncbi:MAG: hypothetical protein ABTD50_23120 [Polyangiaceae bacterium]|jgi:hypothetical protein
MTDSTDKLRQQAAEFCELAASVTDETLLQVVAHLQSVPQGYDGPTPFELCAPYLDATAQARIGALMHRELSEAGAAPPIADA